MHILLAEDNEINQYLVEVLLKKKGYQVSTVSDGSYALEVMEEQKFDLILMDIQMPIMDGYEATRRIRLKEKETGEHIPIIALTAYAMQGDKKRALESGMDDYMSKPIETDKLFELIEKHLSRSS